MRRPGVNAILTLSVVCALTSCAEERGSSAAPPVVICGQTVSRSPAGPLITDATHAVTVHQRTVGIGDVYLRLTRGCDRGSTVSYPAGDAEQTAAARTKDHRLALVVLKVRRETFDVTVRPRTGRPYTVAVRLGS